MLSQVPDDAPEAMRDTTQHDVWSERTAVLLKSWGADWERAAAYHAKWSQLCGLAHLAIAGPAVLLPIVFQGVLPDDLLRAGYVCCSVLAALLSFLNCNALSGRHRQASHAYTNLRHDLLCEMSRPPAARRQPSLAVADFKSRGQQTLMASPTIPMHCWCPLMPAMKADFPDQRGCTEP
jgi:hypothetical protein